MKHLSEAEQNALLKDIMRSDGMDRSNEGRMNAFNKAAKKFNLKIKVSRKNTCFEVASLNTTWDNCDEVYDYISSLGVSVYISNKSVEYRPTR